MRYATLRCMGTLLASAMLWLPIARAQQKVLNIEPVFQVTPVYCWLATGQMVFQHAGIPANDPTIFSSTDDRDYQCGEAKGIGAVPTGIPAGPHAYTGKCWNNCALPWCMTGSGSLQGIYNLIVQYPQIVAHTNGNTTFFRDPKQVFSALSPAEVLNEIDNGRPIIAGISPGMNHLPPGISEHAVLIVGYDHGGADLIVNDPSPYQALHMAPAYLSFGGKQIAAGRFWVPYQSMIGPIAWKNTIFNLQPSGNSGIAEDPHQADALDCKIDSTSFPWNPPGTAAARIDGKKIGSFDFGPNGSTSLEFSCQTGHHHFHFSVIGTPVSCSGSFDVDKDNTDFSPLIGVSPFGQVTCSLQ